MRDTMRRVLILLIPAIFLVTGCSSTSVEELNNVVMAKWESLTKEDDRRHIRQSMEDTPLHVEDYRIGPEDVLAISIFEWQLREETRTIAVRVSRTGVISLPVIGDLRVEGRTVTQVKSEIEEILKEQEILKMPRVSLEVKEYQSKRISVVGAVQEPGVYTLHRNVTTLLEILALAGGPDERAGQVAHILRTGNKAGLIRPRKSPAVDVETGEEHRGMGPVQSSTTVDLYELLELGNLSLNMVLVSGDIVHVPEAAKFFVFGYVREPGGFAIKRPTTVLDGIALARGLREREASPEHCILKRRTPEGEMVIPLDLCAIARGEKANLFLEASDIIEVRQTPNKSFWMNLWEGFRSILTVGISPLR